MDMAEKDQEPSDYGRFKGNRKPASVIRQFDGHCIPTQTPYAEPDLDVDYLNSLYED